MFKQSLLVLSGLLVGYIGGMGAVSHSQVYIGAAAGQNWQHGLGDRQADYSACTSATSIQASDTLTAFAGYRDGYLGAEIGGGKLFSSRFDIACPWAVGGQHLSASQRYARINGYIPLSSSLDLVPFIGTAVVRHSNHEEFITQSGEHLLNETSGKTVSPFLGIGLQKNFDGWFARLEYQHMNRVAEDYWTARGFHNSLDTVKFAVGFNFGG